MLDKIGVLSAWRAYVSMNVDRYSLDASTAGIVTVACWTWILIFKNFGKDLLQWQYLGRCITRRRSSGGGYELVETRIEGEEDGTKGKLMDV